MAKKDHDKAKPRDEKRRDKGDGEEALSPEASPPEFEALLDYIKRGRGFDFSGYKRTGLQRRVMRRMQTVGVESFANYQDYLEVHPDEFTHLFNSILINVTGFFRDPLAWEFVGKQIIPRLVATRNGGPIRVWSAGCATGEEAYTVAILLNEAMGKEEFEKRVKIFGTDLDDDALNEARQASYTDVQVDGVPQHLRDKYFERAGNRYVFHKEFRRALIFGRHDLLQDAPISRVDLLTCRNALMYFNSEAQAKVMERFHFALNDEGVLLLGKAEMLFSRLTLFTPLDLKMRAFVKVARAHVRERLLVAANGGGEPALVPIAPGARVGETIVDHMRIREAAFNIDSTAQAVIDPEGFIAMINQQARVLFGLSERDVGRPIQDLEISYRPVDLRSLMDRAKETRRAADMKEVAWPYLSVNGSEPRFFDVQVVPIFDADGILLGLKATFLDVTRYKRLQEELQHSHEELETAYEELQSTNEERETANEELQSTNEELETTNEEIQSTNEELETMNEELQSTNEELQATNEELRVRSAELSQVNAFLGSILSSLRSGVVVIDRELKVRAWNHVAEDLWGLRADEVTGKHFLDLDIGLPVERLRSMIRSSLAGSPDGNVVIPARNRRGREFQCRVTCAPAASDGQGVWGVVLTMEEDKEK